VKAKISTAARGMIYPSHAAGSADESKDHWIGIAKKPTNETKISAFYGLFFRNMEVSNRASS
jgi:hypothetical protein